MTYAIETHGLTRRFGRTEAEKDLTLQVPAGSMFALLGPNGAGKTTTLKLLMNLLRPTRGTAHVLGNDTRHLDAAHFQRVGYVSENQRLPDWMTPGELFDYCRPFYPGWDEELRRRLETDLALAAQTPLRTLSRGTRMKAALLAALAYRPDLVVLDEPFTGLDPVVRDELIRGLVDVSSDRPSTVLVSSHDIDEVERLADWVGFMRDGQLQFAERVPALLGRFRLVEVVPAGDVVLDMPRVPHWLPRGTAGRTLRFIDTRHDDAEAAARIATAFPACDISTSPLPLREIFITLARDSSSVAEQS